MTNLNVNKKVLRETGDSHPPAEDNCLYMVALTCMSKLTDWWTPPIVQRLVLQIMMNLNLKGVMNMISSKILLETLVQWKKQIPNREKMASIINNVMFNPVNREKLAQKLEKHLRPENLNSLKIKK